MVEQFRVHSVESGDALAPQPVHRNIQQQLYITTERSTRKR